MYGFDPGRARDCYLMRELRSTKKELASSGRPVRGCCREGTSFLSSGGMECRILWNYIISVGHWGMTSRKSMIGRV